MERTSKKVDAMKEKISIGHAIKMARTELGLSQEEFGEALGVKYQTVGTWERDEVIPPRGRWERIKALCGINIKELSDNTITGTGNVIGSGKIGMTKGEILSAEEQTLVNAIREHGEKAPRIIRKIIGMIDEISEKIA